MPANSSQTIECELTWTQGNEASPVGFLILTYFPSQKCNGQSYVAKLPGQNGADSSL